MAINDATLLHMLKASGRAGGGGFVRVRGQSFYAIFDNAYVLVMEMTESTTPALTCRTSDVDRLEVVKDDVITVGDKEWRVKLHQADGTGMSVLVLRK